MIILDTNVLSELARPAPDERVAAWLDRQPRVSIWTSSVTIFEIRWGLQIMPAGKRRTALTQATERVLEEIGYQVAPFDLLAAQHAGDLLAAGRRKGRPIEFRDTMIAGVAMAQNASLATRNTIHFRDVSVPLIDPWSA